MATFSPPGASTNITVNGNDISYTYSMRHGALLKGSGYSGISIVTEYEGVVEAGDCPGATTLGSLSIGPGGVAGLIFCINNAAGTAGPSPDANGQVSGWSLYNINGDLDWTADSANPLTVDLQTLANPTTPGNDVPGTMANFDPTQSYSWAVIHWAGSYTGPTDVAALNAATVFDTGGFANSVNGTFSWQLDTSTGTLSLAYAPFP